MNQTTAARFAAAFAITVATTAVNAEDFVFNVPLRYANLDARIAGRQVNCNVYSDAARTDLVAGTGSGRATVDSNGNYTGTLRIAFDARPGRNAADGRYYRCSGGFFYTSPTTDPSVLNRRPGTPFVDRVDGEIPR